MVQDFLLLYRFCGMAWGLMSLLFVVEGEVSLLTASYWVANVHGVISGHEGWAPTAYLSLTQRT